MGYATDTELQTLSELRHSEKTTKICKTYFRKNCKSCPLYQPCNARYTGRGYEQIIVRHKAIESLSQQVDFNE